MKQKVRRQIDGALSFSTLVFSLNQALVTNLHL